MSRRDYLLDFLERTVQGAGDVLTRMIRLRRKKRKKRALQEADRFLFEIGLDPRALDALTPSSLSRLARSGDGETGRLLACAAVLAEKARVHQEGKDHEDNSRGMALRERALVLYLELWKQHEGKRMRFYRGVIPVLATGTRRSRRSRRSLYLLALFFERLGRYDLAENEWAELVRRRPEIFSPAARKFYLRLTQKDEVILAKGGLPLDEVLEALRTLTPPPSV